MPHAEWTQRVLREPQFLAEQAALDLSRLSPRALSACILVRDGVFAPIAMAQEGRLLAGVPSASEMRRSFMFDPRRIPLPQRMRWVDPVAAGVVPRRTATRAPITGFLAAFGLQHSWRYLICEGRTALGALAYAFASEDRPTPAQVRRLDALGSAWAVALQAQAAWERTTAAAPSSPPASAALTHRQSQVVNLVADGLSNAEIATRLKLSHATIKTTLERLYQRFGVRNRMGLVRLHARQ